MTDDEALQILVALGDSHRFEIFRRLLSSPAASAGELIENKAPSTISHHLKILERAGLISSTRHGRQTQYAIRGETLRAFAAWTSSVAELAILGHLSEWLVHNPPA